MQYTTTTNNNVTSTFDQNILCRSTIKAPSCCPQPFPAAACIIDDAIVSNSNVVFWEARGPDPRIEFDEYCMAKVQLFDGPTSYFFQTSNGRLETLRTYSGGYIVGNAEDGKTVIVITVMLDGTPGAWTMTWNSNKPPCNNCTFTKEPILSRVYRYSGYSDVLCFNFIKYHLCFNEDILGDLVCNLSSL